MRKIFFCLALIMLTSCATQKHMSTLKELNQFRCEYKCQHESDENYEKNYESIVTTLDLLLDYYGITKEELKKKL